LAADLKTYCFDLDGTLCEPVGMNYASAVPYPKRIAIVNELYDQGHTIIIDSARGSISGEDWWDRTRLQLDGWGLKYHQVRTGTKIFADYYVDDRAFSDREFFCADD
jgi:hypothetical protein